MLRGKHHLCAGPLRGFPDTRAGKAALRVVAGIVGHDHLPCPGRQTQLDQGGHDQGIGVRRLNRGPVPGHVGLDGHGLALLHKPRHAPQGLYRRSGGALRIPPPNGQDRGGQRQSFFKIVLLRILLKSLRWFGGMFQGNEPHGGGTGHTRAGQPETPEESPSVPLGAHIVDKLSKLLGLFKDGHEK